MHPSISCFPSKEFYNSNLSDGEGMADLRTMPWHKSSVFGPYRFFDVAGKESRGGTSLINREEVQTAIQLFQRLTSDFPEVKFQGRIGIVTPYRQQLFELKRQFESRFGKSILTDVEFNTVDAFQGRERDIIMFSCVRAADEGGVGFLSDIRRMNVGLTRAKSSLFVLGNSQFLMRNHMWRRLVEDAQSRNVFSTNTRGLLAQSTRLDPNPASDLRMISKQVHGHWDPMDIDDEPPANELRQTSSTSVNQPVPSGAATRPSPHEFRAADQPAHQRLSHPQKNLQGSKAMADKQCRECGQMGHVRSACPKGRGQSSGGHNAPGKRRHESDEDPQPKRVHTDTRPEKEIPFARSEPTSANIANPGVSFVPTSSSLNMMLNYLQPQQPPPKRVIKRKTNGNPLIQRKPPGPPRPQ